VIAPSAKTAAALPPCPNNIPLLLTFNSGWRVAGILDGGSNPPDRLASVFEPWIFIIDRHIIAGICRLTYWCGPVQTCVGRVSESCWVGCLSL